MSREIIFRAKTIKDNEWVQGAYCHYDDIKDNGKDDCDYIIEKHNGEYFPFREIIPETVGQFTGLTDKNGKKIFEGDIVKVKTEYVDETVYLVAYRDCGFKLIYRPSNVVVNLTNNISRYIEVTGNIHDQDIGERNQNE